MFKLTQLFIYKILFVIEILIAMHLFSLKLKKKSYPVVRYILSIIITLIIAVFFPIFDGFSYTWWYSSIMFLFLFMLCMVTMFIIYDSSWQKILFISLTSYSIQHLSHEIYNIVSIMLNLTDPVEFDVYGSEIIGVVAPAFQFVIVVAVFFVVYSIAFVFLNKKINDYDGGKINNSVILFISSLILFTDIILNSFVIYIEEEYNTIYSYTIGLYNILCCFMVLFIQFSVISTKKIQTELDITQQLLQKSEERYIQSKENIDLINLKCHDLRHQIREYGKKGSLSPESIMDLEQMINIYDSTVKTGNKTLDLILTEKSLICQKKNIKLTCLADCSKFNFIADSDLYSLFGNALDNAIEAVMKIKDKDKRSINLIIRNIENYISISIENYFEGSIKLNNEGLPITTKGDSNYHGFGIKSMKYIVEKYKGTLSISSNKDIYSVFILFVI